MGNQAAIDVLKSVPTVRPAEQLKDYSTETLFPKNVASKFATIDRYHTHYLEAGDPSAPAVILFHGGANSMGLGVERWHAAIGPLSEKLHVYALDELGHGRTDPPRDVEKLVHTRVRAEHAIAFIKEMKLGPIHVLGQSQGCWIAAYIALAHPELVKRLILVDSASTSGVETAKITKDSKLLPFNQNIFLPGTRIPKMDLKTREGLREMFKEFYFEKKNVTDNLIEHSLKLSHVWNDLYIAHDKMVWENGEHEGLLWRQEQYTVRGQHISAFMHELKMKTLVIWGRESNKGLDGGYEMYKKLPNAQMHIIDKANHFVWEDRPKTFSSLVKWYLTEDE